MRIDRLVILSLLVACKVTAPTTTGSYSEDLSIHRPVSTIELQEQNEPEEEVLIQETYEPLTGHIKDELDSIAKVAYLMNKEGRYVDGFVIQVYSGNSRNEANKAKTKMVDLFPELDPKISYRQPSFRVKGGKFIDRLEAHRIHSLVKEEFPKSLLIPERFLLTYE